jgi:hypothetical protein
MRIVGAVVCSLVVAAFWVSAAATRDENQLPTLRLADRQPLVLRGLWFAPGERVRVTVAVDEGRAMRRSAAGARGTFSANFAPLALDRCNGLFASAVGSEGSRAALKLKAQPQCPPA